MARGSAQILDDDEEIDLVTFMLDACGVDYSDFFYDERILTKENLEKNFKFLSKMVLKRQSRRAAYFVIGYLILITGSRIPEELRQKILENTKWEDEETYWIDEENIIERKIYLDDFHAKVRKHVPGQKLHPIRLIYLDGKNYLYNKDRAQTIIGVKEFQEACNTKQIYNAKHVNLQGWGLKILPDEIFKIKGLESLCLEYNQLSEIPEEISKLTSLKILGLDYNNFREFPESITRLSSLEDVLLDNNYLSNLPESINKFKTLKILSVRGNKIKEIPTYIELGKVKIFHKYNK